MADCQSLLDRLAEADDKDASRLSKRLANRESLVLSRTPAHVTVYEAAHLWRVRLENSRTRGQDLHRAVALLQVLGTMTQQKKLEQVGFSDEVETGVIFFEQASGRFIGAVTTERSQDAAVRVLKEERSPAAR